VKKSFRIGQDVLPKKRDLGRYVKWPRYVRIQRQKKIITMRRT
jgi:large subunit ribosomal protein L7Ae